jgi:hypothetical protein
MCQQWQQTQGKNMVELREFCGTDWQAWAGVESDNPLIAEKDFDNTHVTMIVDDAHIQVVYMDASGFSDGRYVMIDFPTKGASLLFAMKIQLSEEPEVLEFIAQEMGGIVENIYNPEVGRV